MNYEYDALVFIGRFSPFHLGHKAVVDEALKKARCVIICIGSADEARSLRNPFTAKEREEMITETYRSQYDRIYFAHIRDFPYDDARWVQEVQDQVHAALYSASSGVGFTLDTAKIGLIGHAKDHTSYYLKMFPGWGSVEVENYMGLNATDIRERLYRHPERGVTGVPLKVEKYLLDLLWAQKSSMVLKATMTPWFWELMEEHYIIGLSKESWKKAPYPPVFVTVDAVVHASGHVLLVKRKSSPGKGLWALPGGFLNQEERILDGMIRELREETKIKVPEPVLRGSIKDSHVFDAVNRSSRGRTITHAFYVDLGFDLKLPKVTGADDAEKAKWVQLKDVRSDEMFEDHYHIIDWFMGVR